MRGSTAKLLRAVRVKLVDGGHPVSLKKLKRRWTETPGPSRRRMLDNMMAQGGVYWTADEREKWA